MNLPPLNRRNLLRAAGVTLALPVLERFSPSARADDAAKPIRRMVCMNTTLGIHPENFFPKTPGKDFEATPYLKTLNDYRDQLTVFSGVSHPDVDGGHSAEASFLTTAPHPGGSSFRNTISLDQFIAEKLGAATRISSLLLNTSNGTSSSSFNRSGVMLPADYKPSIVFKKLFIDGTPAEVKQQVARLKDGQSIMDLVLDQTRRIRNSAGTQDRERLDQYFTSVREVEQRLVKAEEWSKTPKPKVDAKPPVDIADQADVLGRTRLLFDLLHLALQTDSTRLATVVLSGLNAVPVIPGVKQDWHNLSHHGKDPGKIAELAIIENAQLECLRDLVAKLKATAEPGGTLLDHTMILYGSNLGNASSHDNKNMPMLLLGGGFKHGQHLAFDQKNNTALGQLFVSMLQRQGIETDQFGSGKGRMTGLEFA
jgi:hypothetical protein